MQNFSDDEAVQNFPHLLDDVATRHQVITVQGANRQPVVMISKHDYDSLSATHGPQTGLQPPAPAALGDNTLGGWL